MATFPTTIPMDLQTTEDRDDGIVAVIMDDLSPHTQTFGTVTDEWVDFVVHNTALTQAERDSAFDFLRNNQTLEIDLVNPADGRTYSGRRTGGMSQKRAGGDRWDISWPFRAERTA